MLQHSSTYHFKVPRASPIPKVDPMVGGKSHCKVKSLLDSHQQSTWDSLFFLQQYAFWCCIDVVLILWVVVLMTFWLIDIVLVVQNTYMHANIMGRHTPCKPKSCLTCILKVISQYLNLSDLLYIILPKYGATLVL